MLTDQICARVSAHDFFPSRTSLAVVGSAKKTVRTNCVILKAAWPSTPEKPARGYGHEVKTGAFLGDSIQWRFTEPTTHWAGMKIVQLAHFALNFSLDLPHTSILPEPVCAAD